MSLLAMPSGMGKRYELVAGELRVMSPSGWRHGEVVDNIAFCVWIIYPQNMNWAADLVRKPDFYLKRDPDTVRAPDFAFIAKEQSTEIRTAKTLSGPAHRTWPWRSFARRYNGRG